MLPPGTKAREGTIPGDLTRFQRPDFTKSDPSPFSHCASLHLSYAKISNQIATTSTRICATMKQMANGQPLLIPPTIEDPTVLDQLTPLLLR